MRLAAGLLTAKPQVVETPDTTLVLFSLSVDRLSETALMDAAQASPGRYVGELLRRLRRQVPEAPVCLAFNPRLELAPGGAEWLLFRAQEAGGRDAAFWLFTDERSRPLAYALRAADVDACPAVHLGLLSTVDAELDERLLRATFGRGEVIRLGAATMVSEGANRFVADHPALHFATERAAALLERQRDAGARRELVLSGDRAAVVGYHAGDVLFSLEGLRLESAPFRSIVVLKPYADVVAHVCPQLNCLAVDQPIPNRPGFTVTDEYSLTRDYLLQLEDEGHAGHFWHFLRPIYRDYNLTRHHMRESFAFAVGGAGHALRPLSRVPLAMDWVTPAPGRVVVHFEAGWALKEFPRDRRGELLDLLVDAGYAPVLLGKGEPSRPEVPAVSYTGLTRFRELLAGAVALIGADSFPAHFAQLSGVPTVQLFGSTRPQNARGLESGRYRYLHRMLPCVPCYQTTECRLDQGGSCHAQASAGEVLAALQVVAAPAGRPAP